MELMKPGGWDMVQLCRLLPKTGAIIPLAIQAGGQCPPTLILGVAMELTFTKDTRKCDGSRLEDICILGACSLLLCQIKQYQASLLELRDRRDR